MKNILHVVGAAVLTIGLIGQVNAQQRTTTKGALPSVAPVQMTTVKGATGVINTHPAITDDSRGGAPVNDLCTGAAQNDLAVGQTISISGNNTGATDDLGAGFLIVYESFTLTTCADIAINYCVPGYVFDNFLINLTSSCPDILTGLLTSSSYTDCVVSFPGLPAGTYYIPVLADIGDTPQGDYTIEVSASTCDVYCAASATSADFEVINHVTFAGIDNATASTLGYENHTDIVAQVEQGGSYPLTITVDDGYSSDQVLVWIDFNNNLEFDANELVLSVTGAGPQYTSTVTVPANAALGTTRMRIRLQDADFSPNNTACGTNSYGQVQDYSVNIAEGSGGNTPANDECSNATVLTVVPMASCGTASTAGDNSNATDSGQLDCDDTDLGYQDVWYTFNSGTHEQVRIAVDMITMEDLVIEVTTGSCGSATVVDCEITDMMQLTVTPNTDYWVRLASNTDWGNGGTFTICVSYNDGSGPVNDLCTGAEQHDLAVGQTISISGNNTGATDDLGAGFLMVYDSFTLTECADITINYCVPGYVFDNFLINLSSTCPDFLTGLLTSSNYTDCEVSFPGLPAGTYYIPVLADIGDTPQGDYTIEVSATACDVYCAASAASGNFEVINNVAFAGIDNATSTTLGYENHTDIVAQVVQGGSYPITITVDDGWDSDEVLVWIDFNNNQVFDDNELVMTSNGAGPLHTGTVTVPADATVSLTRMRIRMQDTDFSPNSTPCGTHSYGQVQDYSVNIDVGSGVASLTQATIQVFPNPSNGDFTVVMPEMNGVVNLDVLDMAGRVVFASTAKSGNGSQMHLGLNGKVAPGSYVLRVTNNDMRSEQRIVIY